MHKIKLTTLSILAVAISACGAGETYDEGALYGQAACVDEDGDGYGWNGTSTCDPNEDSGNGNEAECLDPDGDGYGWNGTESCDPSGDTSDTNVQNGDPKMCLKQEALRWSQLKDMQLQCSAMHGVRYEGIYSCATGACGGEETTYAPHVFVGKISDGFSPRAGYPDITGFSSPMNLPVQTTPGGCGSYIVDGTDFIDHPSLSLGQGTSINNYGCHRSPGESHRFSWRPDGSIKYSFDYNGGQGGATIDIDYYCVQVGIGG